MTILELVDMAEKSGGGRGAKICIGGKSGVGKTSLVWTLDRDSTLFIDLEAGDLALEGWEGTAVRPRTWDQCRDIACILGGPNPARRKDQAYAEDHYNWLTGDRGCNTNEKSRDFGKRLETEEETEKRMAFVESVKKFNTIFVDSITHAGRLCFQWCTTQPDSYTKDGAVNTLGTYGLHGREMIGWLTQLQHIREKNVIFACILDEKTDDFNRKVFNLQIDGAKTGIELPGIVDELITMTIIYPPDGSDPYRAFVCHTINPYGFPAKDRSGRLSMIEQPHLGKVLDKLKAPRSKGASKELNHNLPSMVGETTAEEMSPDAVSSGHDIAPANKRKGNK